MGTGTAERRILSTEMGQAEVLTFYGDRLDPPFRQFVGFEYLMPGDFIVAHASPLEF